MHNAAFAALGIPARYDAVEAPPATLGTVFRQLRDDGYRGWNLTVPLKELAVSLVDQIEQEAALAGSVNTVVVRSGRLHGHSTDGYGLLQALAEAFGFIPAGRCIALIGCGGAGRAVAFALAAAGAARLILLNRTPARAAALAEALRQAGFPVDLPVPAWADAEGVATALRTADVLIQATSLGLRPEDSLPLPEHVIPAGVPAMDMIYRTTPFMTAAARRGAPVADGRAMLLHQGARSFTLWTGRPAPVETMRRALAAALEARQ